MFEIKPLPSQSAIGVERLDTRYLRKIRFTWSWVDGGSGCSVRRSAFLFGPIKHFFQTPAAGSMDMIRPIERMTLVLRASFGSEADRQPCIHTVILRIAPKSAGVGEVQIRISAKVYAKAGIDLGRVS